MCSLSAEFVCLDVSPLQTLSLSIINIYHTATHKHAVCPTFSVLGSSHSVN